jgi:DNA polymerase
MEEKNSNMSKIIEFLKWQNEISPFLVENDILKLIKKEKIQIDNTNNINLYSEKKVLKHKIDYLDSNLQKKEKKFQQTDLSTINNMEKLRSKVISCKSCNLYKTKTKYVFGEGNENADIMFIGEGPGHDEDISGQPFVGRAGQLLTKIIENGLKIPRETVYIANIVKCRPPSNRNPLPNEGKTCLPFLIKQIEFVKPKTIILLGKVPVRFLLNIDEPLKITRTKNLEYKGIKVFATYHPSALLRNPAFKKPAWEDMKKVIRFLNLYNI